MVISRRSGLRLVAAASLGFFPKEIWPAKVTDFWNQEDPSKWTDQQIEQLTSDSPWAKHVDADVKAYTNQSASGRRGGGGRMGRSQQSSAPNSNAPKFSGVVRWVSAKPMLLALKLQLPADLAQHYVIGVSGLPIISGHSEGPDSTDSYDALKEVTYLQVKGQESAQPGVIVQAPNDGSTVLFGFLHQFLDLSSAKVATFTTKIGPLDVKAKFDLPKMRYKDELAV